MQFTRNDRDAGLVNGQMARVAGVEEDQVRLELEDGATITLGEAHPGLRFLDHAWATTINSFQGRTVDTIVAAMELGNASLVNQKAPYVAISRARYRADLITNDGRKLSDHLERASGERISALDAAAHTAAVKSILRDASDGADIAKVAQAHGPVVGFRDRQGIQGRPAARLRSRIGSIGPPVSVAAGTRVDNRFGCVRPRRVAAQTADRAI